MAKSFTNKRQATALTDDGSAYGEMDRKTRICIWVILVGLLNFLVFAILYMFIGGEAVFGHVEQITATGQTRYILQSGREVSLGIYLYSGIHSLSIWPTVAAVMLAMLALAKDRIVLSMHSAIVRGRAFLTILATVITMMVVVITIWFILQFSETFAVPKIIDSPDAPAAVRP